MTNGNGNSPLGGDQGNGLNGSSSHVDAMFRGVAAGIAAAVIVVVAVTLGS